MEYVPWEPLKADAVNVITPDPAVVDIAVGGPEQNVAVQVGVNALRLTRTVEPGMPPAKGKSTEHVMPAR